MFTGIIETIGVVDSISKRGVKLSYKFNEKEEKVRIIRNSGKEI